ncbi:MAG: Rpn family recombination-promoting nuclease/putative transposase [Clostridiales bacterium]|nr:Rpn family recombination-promoting nuclease/putative transposase [Clostridiales bacterium]
MAEKTLQYQGMTVYKAKYDLIFKEVFLGDLALLASLLSSILEIDIQAEYLAVLNTELVPAHESGRLSRLDIRIKTSGKHIDLELQLENRYNMDKRSIFYMSKLFIEQMLQSMDFKDLCPAIAINIMDFACLPYAEYHNQYRLKNTRTHDELTDVIELHFIELPKVRMTENDNVKDMWMQFLSAESGEVLEMLAKRDPMMEKAIQRLVYVSAEEKLRYEMAMREKAELDYYNDMTGSFDKGKEEGLEEGLEKGLEKGREEGREEARLEDAKSLLGILDIQTIAQKLRLSTEEIAELEKANLQSQEE